jgi:hypothetical protein
VPGPYPKSAWVIRENKGKGEQEAMLTCLLPFVLVYAALTFKGLSSTKSIIQSSRTKRKMKKKRQRHEWVIMSR